MHISKSYRVLHPIAVATLTGFGTGVQRLVINVDNLLSASKLKTPTMTTLSSYADCTSATRSRRHKKELRPGLSGTTAPLHHSLASVSVSLLSSPPTSVGNANSREECGDE